MPRLFLSFLLASLSTFTQVPADLKIEKIAAGMAFTEGPVWSRDGFLLFSDVPNNRIMKFVPGVGVSLYRDQSNGANGNTFDDKGRLYTCESRTHRVIRTDKKGKVEVLAESYQGKRLNAPNDITVSKSGHVYFTDPAFGAQAEKRELDFYGIYQITPKGELVLLTKHEGRPNGIALSPNGKILYVANSDEKNLRAYDVAKDGSVVNGRILISGVDGPPDGIRVDEKGNLYVTANGLAIYSPEGKLIQTIQIPEIPRNCAFGDPDFQTLYITAMTSVYRVRLDFKGAVPY